MKTENLDVDVIKQNFIQGIDCSQVVAEAFADETGYSEEELRRVSACFGGGMMCGETCGAVTAGLMILGLLHGHTEPNDIRQKEEMTSVAMKFRERMLGEFGSTMCEELLGHPIPSEMDKVLEEGTMFTLCPRIVKAAIEAVSELV